MTRERAAPAPDAIDPDAREGARPGIRADLPFLAAVLALALGIRLYRPWPSVFTSTHVNLLETDGWYHLRAIESFVRNFPHTLGLDPYAVTGGQHVPLAPLFDIIVGTIALVVGLGHPTSQTIVTVGVFAPPTFGVLTVLVVYLAGREFAGARAGLLAAALAATMPGHFLDRTLLGFVDHHALESFLSTGVLYLLLRALRADTRIGLSALSVGGTLAAYMLTWTSGAFLAAVLFGWTALAQTVAGVGRASIAAGRVMAAAAVVALALVWLLQDASLPRRNMQLASLAALAGLAALFEAAMAVARRRRWSSLVAPAVVAIAVAAGAVAVRALAPALTSGVLIDVLRFTPSVDRMQVLEARPLLLYFGTWSLWAPWEIFRSGFYVGLVALVALAIRAGRRRDAGSLLVVVWGFAMYAATLGQNRFGYYLGPIAALLGGWLCSAVVEAGRRAGGHARTLAVVAVAALVFSPGVVPAVWTTGRPAGLPSGWVAATDWLRTSTAEPFGDAAYYEARYDSVPSRLPAYSVMAWWDSGYWVTQLARRVPVANPTQAGAVAAAVFYTAASEEDAVALLDRLGAHYVVADEQMPFIPGANGALVGRFENMVAFAGLPSPAFYFPVLVADATGRRAVRFAFTPEYYRSMAFRLAVLGGDGASPLAGTVTVMTTVDRAIPGTEQHLPEVTDMAGFSTFLDADAYLRTRGPGTHRIVGWDPTRTVVPLPPLNKLQTVFVAKTPGRFGTGAVRIFERIAK